jgi:hypothetical protein
VVSDPGRQVALALRAAAGSLDDAAFAKLTESPASQVDGARQLGAGVLDAPTEPAWRRYTGVVHGAASPSTLSTPQRTRFRRHLGYVSALAGLVFADEPLPAYRLPMGANLAPVGPLAGFWRDRVEARLAHHLAPGAKLWVLTGGEYERALGVPPGMQSVEVSFVEDKGGGRDGSPPSAALKQARGTLARFLAQLPGAGRSPDGKAWDGVTFHAGLRDFHLADATGTSQLWRATPS